MAKGRKLSEEHKRRIGNALHGRKGHSQTKETREKISNTLTGYKRPPRTEEHKRKLSKALKGRKCPWVRERCLGVPRTEEEKEHLRKVNLGKKLSEEHKRKIGDANRGEKSSQWHGGISSETRRVRSWRQYKLWRKAVFERDDYTCQKCLKVGEKLNPHHILNFGKYPELRFAIDNGITLCVNCHNKFHKKYGHKNNTKEQMEEFLKIRKIPL